MAPVMSDKVKIEDLRSLKKDALEEILLRQEKILSNQRLLRSLPDKGRKIVEYVEKLRLAVRSCEEEERRRSAAGAGFPTEHHRDRIAPREAAEASEDASKDPDLVKSLEMMRVSDSEPRAAANSPGDNYFLKTHERKIPHCLIVLDKKERTEPSTKQRFKPNQILQREVISAQDRRVRDQKHLDDITAATLPPLHYDRARLLSLAESADLLQQQMKRTKELQAKMAAQKLSQGLTISMGSYSPDDSPAACYREVRDEEDED